MHYPKACSFVCTRSCDNNCKHCTVRSPYPGSADFDIAEKVAREFKELGGWYFDATGGNPLLVPWLPDLLKINQEIRLYTSLTVSGKQIIKRTNDWGERWFLLPTLLRFSIDGDREYHDINRGRPSNYDYTVQGIEVATKIRSRKKTQIIFTVMPGAGGNLNRNQFASVLELARRTGVIVSVNLLFNLQYLTPEEINDLRWFAKQADIQLSKGKIRFVMRGGNNRKNPTCKAAHSVVTISPDGEMVLPCYYKQVEAISILKGLKAAYDSPERKAVLEQDGRYDFCQGCSRWCYVIPSFLYHILDRAIVGMHCLSGLQGIRDPILRLAGKLHLSCPHPNFHI